VRVAVRPSTFRPPLRGSRVTLRSFSVAVCRMRFPRRIALLLLRPIASNEASFAVLVTRDDVLAARRYRTPGKNKWLKTYWARTKTRRIQDAF
jgi:hypothetical protein